jgi:hypothetical protein
MFFFNKKHLQHKNKAFKAVFFHNLSSQRQQLTYIFCLLNLLI